LNLENPTWRCLSIGTRFHSTLWNTSTNRELFFSTIGEVRYVDIGKKGNLRKISNDEAYIKLSITLSKNAYLEDYRKLINDLTQEWYKNENMTW
jgi:hypothetical protein